MVHIVYLTASDGSQGRLQEEVSGIFAARGAQFAWIPCSSMQAMEYALYRETDAVALISERCCPGGRLGAWDIAGLRDIRKVRVIACVDRIRYGTSYMAVLYAGGVMDALYEDDLEPRRIADLIQNGRRRGESRAYYGITAMEEVVSVLQVMEQEVLERYVRYIRSGVDEGEMVARYQEVTNKLSCVERCCLTSSMPEDILEEIGETIMPEKSKPPRAEKVGRLHIF